MEQTLVENIPEGILKQTTLRRTRVSLKEVAEELGLEQESGKNAKVEDFPGSQKSATKTLWIVKASNTVCARY